MRISSLHATRSVLTATPGGGELASSAELQRKTLKRHELEVRQSTQKMRDLAINIKMKEQLIRELVKSSRDAQSMNEQYKEKLTAMEKVRDYFNVYASTCVLS